MSKLVPRRDNYAYPTIDTYLNREIPEDGPIEAEELLKILRENDFLVSLTVDVEGELVIDGANEPKRDLDLCLANMEDNVTIRNCHFDSISFENTHIRASLTLENVTLEGTLILPENLDDINDHFGGVMMRNVQIKGQVYF